MVENKKEEQHSVFEVFIDDSVISDGIMGKLEELSSKGTISLTAKDYENMSQAEMECFEEEGKAAFAAIFQKYREIFLEFYWFCIENAVKTTANLYKNELTYKRLKEIFMRHEEQQKDKPYSEQTHLTAHITFTEDSFTQKYSADSRTYVVSSNNKAFQSNKGGYSIFASCLDGTDSGVRLEQYIPDECGETKGWKIEKIKLIRTEETAL